MVRQGRQLLVTLLQAKNRSPPIPPADKSHGICFALGYADPANPEDPLMSYSQASGSRGVLGPIDRPLPSSWLHR